MIELNTQNGGNDIMTTTEKNKDEWDDFADKYKPVKNHFEEEATFDGCMFETYGDNYKYVESLSIDPNTSDKIWTICEEDGLRFIQAGWHFVNRLGYVITEIPFNNKDEQYCIN